MSFMSALEVHTTCLWQALAWILLLSFPVTVEAHWIEGCVMAVHSCTMLAACLPLAVIFCMHNPNRRHRDPNIRERGPGEMAVARMVAGAPPPAPPPPPPQHQIVYPQGFHGRGLPISAINLISQFLPALRIRREMGEDNIITPMIPPLYFLLSERMVVRMLAGLKGEGLVRRRLWRKQPEANMVVPRSAMVTPPPEPDAPPSAPLLSALVPQDGIGDRFWDIDFLILPLLHHSLALFADFWVLGGSSLRSTNDFPEGLELATYPYTLRALPEDGDCRMLLQFMNLMLLQFMKLTH